MQRYITSNTAEYFLTHCSEPLDPEKSFDLWPLDHSYPRPEVGKPIPEEYADGDGYVVLEILDKENPITKFLVAQEKMDDFYHSDGMGKEIIDELINLVAQHALKMKT